MPDFRIGATVWYIGDPCPKCGRFRVERYTCGRSICEKCHYCVEEDRYVTDEEISPLEEV
jgi:ribosomal protein L37AE/L43A